MDKSDLETIITNEVFQLVFNKTGAKGNFYPIVAKYNNGLCDDGEVEFSFNDTKQLFRCEIKNSFLPHHLKTVVEIASLVPSFIVIARTISPAAKAMLLEKQISYLDTQGNIFIKTKMVHIYVDGKKSNVENKSTPNRAFTKTGLKVVGNLLLNQSFLERSYSSIAKTINISKSNITYTINGLWQMGFIQFINIKGKRRIERTDELLKKWMYVYEEKLKPALFLGNFRFTDNNKFNNWKNIALTDKSWWGGEAAADLMTNYLRPQILTIYTEEKIPDMVKNYKLFPDKSGSVKVYRKFWVSENNRNEITVPALLVYADLMTSGDNRCIETAELIYEQYISK